MIPTGILINLLMHPLLLLLVESLPLGGLNISQDDETGSVKGWPLPLPRATVIPFRLETHPCFGQWPGPHLHPWLFASSPAM